LIPFPLVATHGPQGVPHPEGHSICLQSGHLAADGNRGPVEVSGGTQKLLAIAVSNDTHFTIYFIWDIDNDLEALII